MKLYRTATGAVKRAMYKVKDLYRDWEKKKREVKVQIGEMSIPELCRTVLRLLLQLVTVVYLICMLVFLPFYFEKETGYVYIGTNKSDFFMNKGFAIGKAFLYIFIFYVVFVLLCFFVENKGEKGKFSILLNYLLDEMSLTDKFAIVYAIGVFLSYYYTNYRTVLRLGTSGWYMGFLPQLLMLGSYFAVSRLLPKWAAKWTAGVLIVVPFLVFLLGLLNRYGVNPLGIMSIGPGFISTIGNINWYCGYWSVLYPVAAGCFVFYRRKEGNKTRNRAIRAVLGCAAAVGFATGITQGSDSGALALVAVILLIGTLAVRKRERLQNFLELLLLFCGTACALSVVQLLFPERNQYMTLVSYALTKTMLPWVSGIVLLCMYLWLRKKLFSVGQTEDGKSAEESTSEGRRAKRYEKGIRRGWYIFMGLIGLILVSFIVMVVVNTLHPGSIGALSENPLFTFNREWGSGRGGTWKAGIRAWSSLDSLHKVVGIGPDGMAEYIYKGPDSGLLDMVRSQFGNSRLTNAHGEWITILANLGIIGLFGFAGMIVSAIVRFLRTRAGRALCMACGLAIFSYTINNIFSFQQIMNISQMFIVLGLGEWLRRQERE